MQSRVTLRCVTVNVPAGQERLYEIQDRLIDECPGMKRWRMIGHKEAGCLVVRCLIPTAQADASATIQRLLKKPDTSGDCYITCEISAAIPEPAGMVQ